MVVNLLRPGGETVRLEPPIVFEGDEAQPGVLVTFSLGGTEMTGRVIEVFAPTENPTAEELVVAVEAVDRDALDAESELALANLPASAVNETAEGK
ncbi:MAG TPA: hypothetical protein VFA12_15500 [Stellaceae bacterium]|nr:hypothetical protein [Stellaceae bacterium]